MKIIVCVKEVPDTTEVKMDPEQGTLIREGVPSIVNPFDAFALELALQIKDEHDDIEIVTLSMGPPHAEKSLRETIGMGADRAVLITDRAFAGSDTWATSYTLSAGIKKLGGADLVFVGQQAIDGDTGQVGPGIAQFLGWPQAIFVRAVRNIGDNEIEVERITESGYDVVKLGNPAVISVIKLPKDPRLPSLRGMMKAKKAEIAKWGVADLDVEERNLGLSGSPTRVMKIFSPPKRKDGEIFEGEPAELAAKCADLLREQGIV